MKDAIWITGLGATTPMGDSFDVIADNLLAGRSGIKPITAFDPCNHGSHFAGLVPEIPCPASYDETEFRALPRLEQMVAWCTEQALRDAGLWDGRRELRIGFVAGMGAEWMLCWEDDLSKGGNLIRQPEQPQGLLHRVYRKLEITGPSATVGAACASASIAIAQAKRWLELGWLDVCLAGGMDASVTPRGLASFGNLGALSKRNHAPAQASRPFDRGRDGFVMSEGGVAFVMERAEHARRRRASGRAHVAGFGASSDASHLVIPSSDPAPAARAIRLALANAGVNPGDVDTVNAHATSTPVGDKFETQALYVVFGDDATRIPVSATKSMSGHMLSAAAAFETLGCIVAMEREAMPPTINLDEVDPECNLCHVVGQARPGKVRVALNNSFGFGGSNTALVLRKAG